jgi:Zn-dependent protease
LPSIDFIQVFIAFFVLLFSLTVHEAAHAWSADRLGDRTARQLGRVSLNPAVHVDPIGTILFPLIAMFTNVPLLGWAKPVPVNIMNLRGHWKRKYMMIAAAGPASNLLIAVIAALILRPLLDAGLGGSDTRRLFALALYRVVELNIILAIFNMLPVPPLDGGNVLAGLLRGQAARIFDSLRPYGFLILYALLLTGVLWSIVVPIETLFRGWLL